MRRNLILLAGVIMLYVLPSLALNFVYGPSYGFLSGEDCWIPDNQGGWMKHGNPSGPAPSEPSAEVPLVMQYVPIFLPGLLLAAFLFTPLRHRLNEPKRDSAEIPPEDG